MTDEELRTEDLTPDHDHAPRVDQQSDLDHAPRVDQHHERDNGPFCDHTREKNQCELDRALDLALGALAVDHEHDPDQRLNSWIVFMSFDSVRATQKDSRSRTSTNARNTSNDPLALA